MGDTHAFLSFAKDAHSRVLTIQYSRLRRGPVIIIRFVGHCPRVVLHTNDVRVRLV